MARKIWSWKEDGRRNGVTDESEVHRGKDGKKKGSERE
jgi:hypothetical protein